MQEELLNSILAIHQSLQAENHTIQRINRLNERIAGQEGQCSQKLALKLANYYSQELELSLLTKEQVEKLHSL